MLAINNMVIRPFSATTLPPAITTIKNNREIKHDFTPMVLVAKVHSPLLRLLFASARKLQLLTPLSYLLPPHLS